MAMQPDIQYVRFYTAGSAARKLELLPKKEKATLSVPHRPRAIRRKKTVICVDPVAMFATLVAVVMFVAMGIGMVQLFTVQAQNRQMDSYLSDLRAENAQLQEQYRSGYDLKDVEQKALEMGLVPIEQVEKVIIEAPAVQEEPAPTFWENVGAFFGELFGA